MVLRMTLAIFRAVTAGSVLAAAGATALWARSYHTCDDLEYVSITLDAGRCTTYHVISVAGVVSIIRNRVVYLSPPPAFIDSLARRPAGLSWATAPTTTRVSLPVQWEYHGFYFFTGSYQLPANPPAMPVANIDDVAHVRLPQWIFVVAALFLPAVGAMRTRSRIRRARRSSLSRCASCGYDLRATPNACPECGTPAASPPAIAERVRVAASTYPDAVRARRPVAGLLIVGTAAVAVWLAASIMITGTRPAATHPASAPAASQPTNVEFMGVGGRAASVVFVCDASGSMLNKFDTLRRQLSKAITALAPEQRFGIVLMQEEGSAALNASLLPALPENVGLVDDFVVVSRFRAETDPIPAIEAAFSMRPELIYLLTDGDFRDSAAVVRRIRELVKDDRIRINTIAFVGEGDKDTDFLTVLKQVAAESRGTYARVNEGAP